MPIPLLILPLAAAASAAPSLPGSRRYSRIFVSPMGEPFRPAPGLDALQTWFAQADRNRDGILTIDEMQADADRFFATLDLDHDGEIGPDEITKYETNIAPAAPVGLFNLPEPVATADRDFNGGVSLDEFRKAAIKRFEALDVDHRSGLTVGGLESLRPPSRPRDEAPGIIPGHVAPEVDPGG